MRIFIALPISEQLQNEVVKYTEFYPDLPVRWTDGKNLHITLIPPWEGDNFEEIKNILKKTEGKTGPVEMKFKQTSFGPNPQNPRLVWATGEASEKIIKLKKFLEKILQKPSERDDFLLHLTIARFRPEDFKYFPVKKISDEINWQETATEFVIMKSHLTPQGAEYEVMERFKL